MSNKDVWHEGTKSWWNGSVKTDCGLTLPSGTYTSDMWVLWKTGKTCPTCKALKKNRK
ncbi:hypothetical protein [Saccharopolyspora terrae]|uniref:hypothetical protein n=1 Tax=Saccharopolyspora terrae TaxID=2530384 RepID=UPI001405097F|nr:hypothetical protein [Saccharopolyspora terrae]